MTRPNGGRDADVDAELQRQLSALLSEGEERVPADVERQALERAGTTRQRPGWLVRLRQALRGPARPIAGLAFAVGAVALVVVALVLPAILRPVAPDVGASSDRDTAFGGRPTTRWTLDGPIGALGSVQSDLWVGGLDGALRRFDTTTGHVTMRIDLGAPVSGPIEPVAAALWTGVCAAPCNPGTGVSSVLLDPRSGAVVARFDGGGDGVGAAALRGVIWFISDVQQGTLQAVDATTGQPVRQLSLGRAVRHLTAGFGSLWVAPIGRPEVLRIDSETGAVLATVGLSGDAGYLAVSSDAVWVSEPHQWLLGRIDPTLDRLSAEIEAAVGADQIRFDDRGRVWVLGAEELLPIEAASTALMDRITVPKHEPAALDGLQATVLATIGRDVWFADGTDLVRIGR
jgi:hypothetical protein